MRPRRRIGTRPFDDEEPVEEVEPRVERRVWRVTMHFGEKDLYTQFAEEAERAAFVRGMIETQQAEEDAWVYISDGGFRPKFLIGYTLADYPRSRP